MIKVNRFIISSVLMGTILLASPGIRATDLLSGATQALSGATSDPVGAVTGAVEGAVSTAESIGGAAGQEIINTLMSGDRSDPFFHAAALVASPDQVSPDVIGAICGGFWCADTSLQSNPGLGLLCKACSVFSPSSLMTALTGDDSPLSALDPTALVSGGVEGGVGAVGDLLTGGEEALESAVTGDLAGAAEDVVSGAEEVAGDAAGWVSGTVSGAGGTAGVSIGSSALGGAEEAAEDIFGDAVSGGLFDEAGSGLIGGVEEAAEGALGGVEEAAGGVVSDVEEAVEEGATGGVAGVIGNVAGSVIAGVAPELIDQVFQVVEGFFKMGTSEMFNVMKQAGVPAGLVDQASGLVTGFETVLFSGAQKIIEQRSLLEPFVIKGLQIAKDPVKDVSLDIIVTIIGLIPEAGDAIDAVVNMVYPFVFDTIYATIEGAVQADMDQNAPGGTGGVAGAIGNVAGGMTAAAAQEMVPKVFDMADKFFQMGITELIGFVSKSGAPPTVVAEVSAALTLAEPLIKGAGQFIVSHRDMLEPIILLALQVGKDPVENAVRDVIVTIIGLIPEAGDAVDFFINLIFPFVFDTLYASVVGTVQADYDSQQ